MAVKTCGTCRFGKSRADDLTVVDCYGGPPQAVLMPAGPGQMNLSFVRPPMKRTEPACGCHQPLDLLMVSNDADVPK